MHRVSLADLEKRMASLDLSRCGEQELCELVRSLNRGRRTIDGYLAQVATEARRREGTGSGPAAGDLFRGRGEVSRDEAERQAGRGRVSDHFPRTAQRMHCGEALTENMDALARLAGRLRGEERSRLAALDGEIADRATVLPPEVFLRWLRQLIASVSDDDRPSTAEQQKAASRLSMGRHRTGMWWISGEFDPERGAVLDAIIRRMARQLAGDHTPTDNTRAAALYRLATTTRNRQPTTPNPTPNNQPSPEQAPEPTQNNGHAPRPAQNNGHTPVPARSNSPAPSTAGSTSPAPGPTQNNGHTTGPAHSNSPTPGPTGTTHPTQGDGHAPGPAHSNSPAPGPTGTTHPAQGPAQGDSPGPESAQSDRARSGHYQGGGPPGPEPGHNEGNPRPEPTQNHSPAPESHSDRADPGHYQGGAPPGPEPGHSGWPRSTQDDNDIDIENPAPSLGIGYIIDAQTLTHGPHPTTVAQTWAGDDHDPRAVQRLACNTDWYPILINHQGQPHTIGRTRRTATRHQRLALRALYRACPLDGTPFDHCEIHHVNTPHHLGGPTTLNNLLPISTTWHHRIHDRGWTLHMAPDRTLTLTRPNGQHDRTIPPPQPLTRQREQPTL